MYKLLFYVKGVSRKLAGGGGHLLKSLHNVDPLILKLKKKHQTGGVVSAQHFV